MKALTLALLLSLSVIQAPKKPLTPPATHLAKRPNGGRWYLAASGHAIYCFGPVMTVPRGDGGLERVATLCRDGSPMVPLFEPASLNPPEHKEEKSKDMPVRPRFIKM